MTVASAPQANSAAAEAACVADWKANDRARSIRVVLGELALHLSALFAWCVLAGAGLVMLLLLCVPVIALSVVAGLSRMCARLWVGIGGLIELLLGLVHALGVLLVRLVRWLGIPVPPTETGRVCARVDQAPPVGMVIAQQDSVVPASGLAMPPPNGANHRLSA